MDKINYDLIMRMVASENAKPFIGNKPFDIVNYPEDLTIAIRAGIALFNKQIEMNGHLSKDISEWPESLRVRQLPPELEIK